MSKIRICFIGIDGSGKTTHLLALLDKLSSKGLHCKYIPLRGTYFRFISLPLLYLCRIFGREEKIVLNGKKRYIRHPNLISNSAIKTLWSILFLIDMYILAILRGYFWSRAQIILCDRYIVDSLVDLMVALKDYTIYRRRIGRFFLSLIRPDMTLLLDVSEKEAFSRKKDAPSLSYQILRRDLYRRIAADLNIPVINTDRPFNIVHKEIISYIRNILPRCGDHDKSLSEFAFFKK